MKTLQILNLQIPSYASGFFIGSVIAFDNKRDLLTTKFVPFPYIINP
jgi:hypothetical protein